MTKLLIQTDEPLWMECRPKMRWKFHVQIKHDNGSFQGLWWMLTGKYPFKTLRNILKANRDCRYFFSEIVFGFSASVSLFKKFLFFCISFRYDYDEPPSHWVLDLLQSELSREPLYGTLCSRRLRNSWVLVSNFSISLSTDTCSADNHEEVIIVSGVWSLKIEHQACRIVILGRRSHHIFVRTWNSYASLCFQVPSIWNLNENRRCWESYRYRCSQFHS